MEQLSEQLYLFLSSKYGKDAANKYENDQNHYRINMDILIYLSGNLRSYKHVDDKSFVPTGEDVDFFGSAFLALKQKSSENLSHITAFKAQLPKKLIMPKSDREALSKIQRELDNEFDVLLSEIENFPIQRFKFVVAKNFSRISELDQKHGRSGHIYLPNESEQIILNLFVHLKDKYGIRFLKDDKLEAKIYSDYKQFLQALEDGRKIRAEFGENSQEFKQNKVEFFEKFVDEQSYANTLKNPIEKYMSAILESFDNTPAETYLSYIDSIISSTDFSATPKSDKEKANTINIALNISKIKNLASIKMRRLSKKQAAVPEDIGILEETIKKCDNALEKLNSNKETAELIALQNNIDGKIMTAQSFISKATEDLETSLSTEQLQQIGNLATKIIEVLTELLNANKNILNTITVNKITNCLNSCKKIKESCDRALTISTEATKTKETDTPSEQNSEANPPKTKSSPDQFGE